MLDGMPLEDMQRKHPTLWLANLRQTDEHFRWPGGESYREFRQRCLSAVTGVAARHHGRIGLVTHTGVISQVLGTLAGMNPAQWEPFRPGHTSLTRIEWAGRSAKVLRYDDRTHLLPA